MSRQWDSDEGLELRPEVVKRLRHSLDNPREQLLSSEEAWQRFNRPHRPARLWLAFKAVMYWFGVFAFGGLTGALVFYAILTG